MSWNYKELDHSLTNHPPVDEGVVNQFELVRKVAKEMGETILNMCPDSRERSIAITKLEETVMWAIKSIAVNQ